MHRTDPSPAPPPLPAGRLPVLASVVLVVLGAGAAAQDQFQNNGLFSLPRSQDDIHEWRKAREDLDAGRHRDAVERLHRLLQASRHGVVPSVELLDHFRGLRSAVVHTLRAMPEAAREEYERLVAREAGDRLRDAFVGRRPQELSWLARQFPVADAGLRARRRLGDLALERGDPLAATRHYLAAVDATAPDHPRRPELARRLALARALADETGARVGLDDGSAELLAAARASLRRGAAEAYGADHFAQSRPPMTAPVGRPRLARAVEMEAAGFAGNDFALHAVGDLEGVFVTDGLRVRAIDPFRAQILWESDGPLLREVDIGAASLNEYQGQINASTVLAPAVGGDVVVAALQVPTEGEPTRFRSIDVIVKIPARRLVAFDRVTGKQLWTHFDRLGGPTARRFAGHDIASPPLIVGDTVFVASHAQAGAIAYYLAAYDLHSGQPRWRRLVCSSQLEVNMFGNARFEFAGAPLAAHSGVVYGATNLGVVFAADQEDGDLRWVSAYPVMPMPPTQLAHQEDRPVVLANDPPAVCDDVVAFTPIDSSGALAFDCDSGQLLWRLDHRTSFASGRPRIFWLLGAIADEFVFSGRGVVAVKARSGDARLQPDARVVRSAQSLGIDPVIDYLPRGAIADDKIWFPVLGGLRAFDRDGVDIPAVRDLPAMTTPGNLLLRDGMLVVSRSSGVEVYLDPAAQREAAERAWRDHPDDPAIALRLATLLRAEAGGGNAESRQLDEAQQVLRRGVELARAQGLARHSPLQRRLASQLFEIAIARARSLARRSPQRAVPLLLAARDEAPDDERWLWAQGMVLELLPASDPEYMAQLELMVDRFGDREWSFAGRSTMPISAFAAWQAALHSADPAEAVQRWQRLLELHPDTLIDDQPAGRLAHARIAELIRRHGDAAYAAVEQRAGAALATAGDDASALRALLERYPHSRAAADATRSLMDIAVERADLPAAIVCWNSVRDRGAAAPGLQRRLAETARRAGNLPLAGEMLRRLRLDHADVASDFPADGGAAYATLPPLPIPAAAPVPPMQTPTHRVGQISPAVPGARVHLLHVEDLAGFARPADQPLPILVWEGGLVVRAFDRDDLDAPHYSIDCPTLPGDTPLLVCGPRLIVCEQDRVRGFELRSGRLSWTVDGGADEHALSCLGVTAGLLHVFAERRSELIAIEPLTGVVVARAAWQGEPQDLDVPPVARGGSLWRLRSARDRRGAFLDRIDPIDVGRIQHTMALPESLAARLAEVSPVALPGLLLRMQYRLLADGDGVVLAHEGSSDPRRHQPPLLVAVDRDGNHQWTWMGKAGRTIAHLSSHRDGVAMVEAGPDFGARLVLLRRHEGTLRREVDDLGASAHVLNDVGGGFWDRPMSPCVVLAAFHRGTWRLICRSIADDSVAFATAGPGSATMSNPIERPLLGDGFLALAVAQAGADETTVHVYAADSGIETGRSQIQRTQVWAMRRLGPWIALETSDGITILGDTGERLR